MPTVIDTLIVQLGLDPTKFTQGQVQAVGQLRQFHAQVNQQANQTARAFLSLLRPMTQVQSGYNAVTQQSRRAGLAVQQGAKQGAYGLMALASAGAAAFAAIKSIQGAYQQFTSTIGRTDALNRVAQQTGVSAVWLNRLQNAAYVRTAAAPEQTAQSVYNLRQRIERLQAFGEWSDELEKLSILGIDFTKGTPDEILQRIFQTDLPKHLAGLSLPRAMAFGQSIGLSRELTQFLATRNVQQEMQQAAPFSMTPEQLEAASKMAEAVRRIETAFEGLLRALQTSHPEITQILDQFAEWLIKVQNSPQALQALGSAFEAVVAVTMVAAVRTFLGAVLSANAAFLKTPLGIMIAAGMGLSHLLEAPTAAEHEAHMRDPTRVLDPFYWLGTGRYGQPTNPELDDRTWWQRNAPGFLGGKPAPRGATAPIPGATGRPTSGPTEGQWYTGSARGPVAENQGFNYGGIRAPASMGGFRTYPNEYAGVADLGDLLKRYPSRGADTLDKIINMWAPASDNNNTELLIQRAERWTGFGRHEKLNLNDPATLRKVMIAMNRNEMGGRQTIPAGALETYLSGRGPARPGGQNTGYPFPTQGATRAFPALPVSGSGYAPSSGPGYPGRDFVPPTGGWPVTDRQGRNVGTIASLPEPRGGTPAWVASMTAITQAATAGNLRAGGALGAGATTNNAGDVNVGSVVVHTQAKDADQIAYSVGGALQKHLVTAQVNSGLR